MKKVLNDDIIREKIENYVFDNIEVDKNYRCNLKQLGKLEEYIKDIDLEYINNNDLYSYIINNNQTLNSFLYSIIEEFEDEIAYGRLYSFLIGIYCDNNNIEILSKPSKKEYICLDNIDIDIKLDKMSMTFVSEYNERELCLRKENGDLEARTILIEHYINYVKYIASNYLAKKVCVDFQDIKQVGMEALIKAVDNFDCNRGVKLSTYIYCVVTREINNYISDNCRIIKVSADEYKKVLEYKTNKKLLEDRYGELTEYNISKFMHIPLDRVKTFETLASNIESLEELLDSDQLEGKLYSFNNQIEDEINFDYLKYEFGKIIDKINLDDSQKQTLNLYLEEAYYDFNIYNRMAEKLDISRQAVENRMLLVIKNIRKSIYLSDFMTYLELNDQERRELLKKINYYIDLYELYNNDRVDGFVNKNIELGDLRNIYVYFELKGYSSNEVDLILTKLESNDLDMLHFFYGHNLKKTIVNENTLLSEKSEIYKSIFKKITKLLDEQRITTEKQKIIKK